MLSDPIISLENVGKCYQIYDQPRDRLLQMFYRRRKKLFREFWALKGINLDIYPGDVVGIVGRNGSGKSTLLQLVCNTLTPTEGEVTVKGRIAALLELGAGFNPEFTGRENVYLSAMISGMSQAEVAEKFDTIVEFSGIRHFIDQPVKTYSSGMYVRLAFSIAIHVDPDILVIDEALSVGDGEFARKSFDRIMALKDAGKTILFCSHAMYQVDALCNKAMWLDQGIIQKSGDTGEITSLYNNFLNKEFSIDEKITTEDQTVDPVFESDDKLVARLTAIELSSNDSPPAKEISVQSGCDTVNVKVSFVSNVDNTLFNIGVVFSDVNQRVITSAGTHIDKHLIELTDNAGRISISFPGFSLLKGEYYLYVFLLCEKGVLVHDYVHAVAKVKVSQTHLEQGIVSIPHFWGT